MSKYPLDPRQLMRENTRKQTVPKMDFLRYLALTRGIRKDPRFKLSNQEIVNGMVYFRDAAAMRNLQEIIQAHNTGSVPETEVKLQQEAKNEWMRKSDGITVDMTLDALENVRGPDGSGTYTARCISCAERGGDSDSNHLRFHPEKGLHCFAGCFAPQILGLIRMKTMEGSK